jgi:hypothetical protein
VVVQLKLQPAIWEVVVVVTLAAAAALSQLDPRPLSLPASQKITARIQDSMDAYLIPLTAFLRETLRKYAMAMLKVVSV